MDLHTRLPDIPKAELHCHLLGVISPRLLAGIAKPSEVLVSGSALECALPITGKQSFQRVIDILLPYQKASWQAYWPILTNHVEQLIRQNVVYTEIMISPLMFPQELSKMIAAFHEFRQWVNTLEQDRVQVEFLMVLPRSLEEQKVEKNIRQYIELYRAGLIVGVAVVGLENGTSVKRLSPALKRFKEAGLGIEIHAGEHSGPEDVREALDYGYADRIGHGIGLFQDAQLTERILKAGVHIEFCMTSNIRTQSVPSIDQHPVALARQLGISFSLNTDDPGLFDCDLTSEYILAAEHFDFTPADLHCIFEDAIHARFRRDLRYLPG